MSNRSLKHDFTKSMRNTYQSNSIRNVRNSATEYYDIEVTVDPNDKNRLERFFKEETKYYNHLVSGFSSRVRSFPEHIRELDDTWQKIFTYVAEYQDSLKNYVNATKDTELPKSLIPYKNTLLNHLTERKIVLTDIAAGPGTLLPIVRRNMAIEVLRHYREQAERILTPGNNSTTDEGSLYKVAPEMLQEVDNTNKRHLQIPKIGLKIVWNQTDEITEIHSSYTAKPILLPIINLVEHSNWNYMILHQQPGKLPTPSTPWMIDIKKISNNYMLKYVDMRASNRATAFSINKRR